MINTNPWIEFYQPKPKSRLILYCFPYAGGGAHIFKEWNNLLTQEVASYEQAVKLLGLEEVMQTIDKATEGMDAKEYIDWLEANPSAKQTLIEINHLRDQWSDT